MPISLVSHPAKAVSRTYASEAKRVIGVLFWIFVPSPRVVVLFVFVESVILTVNFTDLMG